jgi:hypothetical protein
MIEGLAAAGFSALYVDRFGFADRGASLDAALRPLTGRVVAQSHNRRLRWYDLRPVRDRLRDELSPDEFNSLARAVTRGAHRS